MSYNSKRHTELFDGKQVTPQQHKFLMAIEAHWRGQQLAPTNRELAKTLGVSNSRIHQYSVVLRNRGLIQIKSKTMRKDIGNTPSEFQAIISNTSAISIFQPKKSIIMATND